MLKFYSNEMSSAIDTAPLHIQCKDSGEKMAHAETPFTGASNSRPESKTSVCNRARRVTNVPGSWRLRLNNVHVVETNMANHQCVAIPRGIRMLLSDSLPCGKRLRYFIGVYFAEIRSICIRNLFNQFEISRNPLESNL